MLYGTPDAVLLNAGLESCERIRANLGIDIQPILTAYGVPPEERIGAAAMAMCGAIFARADAMQLQDFLDDPTSVTSLSLAAKATTEPSPNFALPLSNLEWTLALKGQDLIAHMRDQEKRLERAADAKDGVLLAAELIGGGILSVGSTMGVQLVKALVQGSAIRKAMVIAIKAVGIKTVVAAVVLALVALLYWFLAGNVKNIAGFIVNDTDEEFTVADYRGDNGELYMESGTMVSFPEDFVDGLDKPKGKCQIKPREIWDDDPKNPLNLIWSGYFFAEKKFGLYGSEGIAVYRSKSIAFAHMFACPYHQDNGTNIAEVSQARLSRHELAKLYGKLYDSRKVDTSASIGGFKISSRVNDARGGEVGLVAAIRKA